MNVFKYIVVGASLAFASAASAATIDTNPTWDGNVNDGWDGSGQSLSIDAVENHLDDISFYFDAASAGQTFTFTLTDALVGGTTFYSTAFSVLTGINTFLTNVDLTPSSTVYALFDYGDFNGLTAHFSGTDGYAGGQSYFFFDNGGWNESFTGLDHRFIANLSGGPATVPLPAGLPLLLIGLGALGVVAHRRKAA